MAAFKGIHDTLTTIKENHLHHIEKDMAGLKAHADWTQRLLWLILTGIVGGFVTQLWKLIGS